MEIQEYINELKQVHHNLLQYLDNSDEKGQAFTDLCDSISYTSYKHDCHEFRHILSLIVKLADNHIRAPDFFDKMDEILNYLKDQIKKSFTNHEIFNIFKSNKRLLLYLIQSETLTIDQTIFDIFNSSKYKTRKYIDYFYPELKDFIKKGEEEEEEEIQINDEFYENRKKGENEQKLFQLIREDSAVEVKKYIESENISPETTFNERSTFETNNHFFKHHSNLIEYAAYYGSLKVFNIFVKQSPQFTNFSTYCAVHGNNKDILKILVKKAFNNDSAKNSELLKYSIQCHHNDIVAYVMKFIMKMKTAPASCTFRAFNFELFPVDLFDKENYVYAVKYDYIEIVKHFINDDENEIDLNPLTEFLEECKSRVDKEEEEEAEQMTVLRCAAKRNNYEIANLILKKIKTNDCCNSFHDCQMLTRFAIPSTVTEIEDNAFRNCVMLTEVMIPSTVTKIGKHAFDGCKNLMHITIPSSVTSIESYAFNECEQLNQLIIPSSITRIEESTFHSCKKVQQVKIPSTITTIENNAFENCQLLKKVKIPPSVTNIGSYAFNDCLSLTEATIQSTQIERIKEKAFNNCGELRTFSIPDSVVEIEGFAFNGCKNLEELSIPSSVTVIGRNAFCDCYKLKKIFIPSSVTEIGEEALSACTSLIEITIPSSISVISERLFRNCAKLEKVYIPSTIEKICCFAFENCFALNNVDIPPSVKVIDVSAFMGCYSLTEVVIPSAMFVIAGSCFYGCSALASVKIPSSVKIIDSHAFAHCTALTSIEIPSSVKKVDINAFEGCSELKHLTVPSSLNISRLNLNPDTEITKV